ncbi:hypothetical protein ALI22I_28755 [Saccharothrix sp. ALI-22-I]|nr:hypothetical protein ALI22I_28755 [Saccharothrix sp. ALI-22-I]
MFGGSARRRKEAEAGRRRQGSHAQLKALRRSARLFAFVSTAVVGLSIFYGLQAPLWVSVVAIPVVFVALWLLNRWTVGRMHRGVRPPEMPRPRRALGLCAAFFVAFSVTLWVFGSDVEAARGLEAPGKWDKESGRLHDELDGVREIANREVRPTERDPEVERLTKQLTDLRAQLVVAWDNELCELDGSCGTMDEGRGDAYREKKGRRERLESEIGKAEGELANARTAAQGQFDRLTRERNDAQKRAGEIEDQLEQLGPRPQVRTKLSAFSSVDQHKRQQAAGVALGTLGAYFLVDVLAFQWVVRRVCGGPVELPAFKELINEQAEWDERSAKGVIPAAEYLKREGGV